MSVVGEGRRRRELALSQLTRRVLDGDGHDATVLVVGQAGIGKSHFLSTAAAELRAAGVEVGWCGCAGPSAGPPAWELQAALADLPLDPETGDPGGEPFQVFRRVAQALDTAARDHPLVVVLDDMHEATPTTVELFRHLSRRPRQGRWLVIGATRPDCPPLLEARCPQIHLTGVDAADLQDIARSVGVQLDDSAAHRLHHRTGGNPLFARRILERGDVGQPLSSELVALVRSSMAEVAPDRQAIVDALSVLGVSAERRVLSVLVDAGAVADLTDDDVLVVDPDTVAFRHPLLREVHYEELPAERRNELHREAAQTLDQLMASPSVVAHHWGQAALAGQGREAAETAMRAGHLALELGGWAEASAHFAHAGAVLNGLDAADASDDQAMSAVLRARAMSLQGDIAGAAQTVLGSEAMGQASMVTRRLALRELLRLRWREEPNPTVLDGAAISSAATTWLGPAGGAVADGSADETIDGSARRAAAGAADEAVRALVESSLGELGRFTPACVERADDAVANATVVDDATLLAESHLARRRALMADPGAFAARRASSEAAVAAARRVDDRELLGRCLRMAQADAMAHRHRAAALSTLGAFEVAATAGLREHQALAQAGLAAIEGRPQDAADILDEATKELAYVERSAPSLDFVRTILELDTGGLGAALAEYEPLLTVIADPSLTSAFALADALDGHHRRAARRVDRVIELLESDRTDPQWLVAAALAAEAAAAVDHPGCPLLLSWLEPHRGFCAMSAAASVPWVGAIDRYVGLLRLRLGDPEGAVSALAHSLDVHEAMQAGPWQARSHAALAAAHRAAGRAAEASAHQRRAEELTDELAIGPVALIGDFAPNEPSVSGGSPAGRTAVTPAPETGSAGEAGAGKRPAGAATGADGGARALTDPGAGLGGGPGRRGVFRRDGDGWEIGWADKSTMRLRPLAGFAYLDLLLHPPGREWHVLDLYGTAAGGVVVVEGSGGDVLDETARRAYQQRMAELVDDLAAAEDAADGESQSAIRAEIDALEQQVVEAYGLGGRSRRLDDPSERARINVRRAIARAIEAIDGRDPGLADHLRRRVSTGRFCCYHPVPDDPVVWELGDQHN